jgi:hypothetical protein
VASNLFYVSYIVLVVSINFSVVSLFREKIKNKRRKSERKGRNLLKERERNLQQLNGKSRMC